MFISFFFMNVIVAGRRERESERESEGVICVGPYMD